MMGKEKEVWRVAFFSRLEERKGIKLFTDAVAALNVSGLPKFEVQTVAWASWLSARLVLLQLIWAWLDQCCV